MSKKFNYWYWLIAAIWSFGAASNHAIGASGIFGVGLGMMFWFGVIYVIIYACKKVYEML